MTERSLNSFKAEIDRETCWKFVNFKLPHDALSISNPTAVSPCGGPCNAWPSHEAPFDAQPFFKSKTPQRLRTYSKVFCDSAGANIAHNMMMRASMDEDKLGDGLRLVGMALIQPFIGNHEPDRIWSYCCPENPKSYDPRFNPAVHPNLLSKLVCFKVLICTGGATEDGHTMRP
ncbi:putative carboxylesterase 7-like [Capsicum annuum]|nr:putative carboxylesterase 7-like [Capsicum annuum]